MKLTQDQRARQLGITKGQLNYLLHGKPRDERLKQCKPRYVTMNTHPITGHKLNQ